MSTNQLFFAMGGLMVTLFGICMASFKYYLDAKIDGVNTKIDAINTRIDAVDTRIDSLAADVKLLINYMMDHQARIARLEERTK